MANPFIGEIRMFAGNFAPVGWAFCDGQVLSIAENDTLFALIGTTYGGDGESTFALPDLRSRVPIHQGNSHVLGELGGAETVTLSTAAIPGHPHPFRASTAAGTTSAPSGKALASPPVLMPYRAAAQDVSLAADSIGQVGLGEPHENRQPYLAISFIISLFGIFPSQS